MVRRIGTLLLFTAAVGAAAWSAWPGAAVSNAATARADVIVVVVLLAGLPLLFRWRLGPPGNRMARWLRAGCYAAVLAIMAGVRRARRGLSHCRIRPMAAAWPMRELARTGCPADTTATATRARPAWSVPG